MSAVVERHAGLLRLEVDGSGGFDVLYANLTRGLGLRAEPDAHVMTLPYTPLQHARRHVEEDFELAETLSRRPVVCCTLHSQVAPVCAGLGADVELAYVQLAGGALPVSLSDAIRALRGRFRLTTVAVAPCFDGDEQAMGVASALAWAAGQGVDAIVCSIGPGIAGTGSRLGHGGVAAAEAGNAASALDGSPILAARVSSADPRPRHRGVSHHTRAVLDLSLGGAVVAWPAGRDAPAWLEPRREVDASGWQAACAGLPLDHMGRDPGEDAPFFEAAYAAGVLARTLVG